MKSSAKEYAELRGKLGQEAAWAIAASELDYLREQNALMTRVVRRLAKEYRIEGDAIWARVDELVAEEARAILLQAKIRKRFRLVLH
jgi:hypothetical protein